MAGEFLGNLDRGPALDDPRHECMTEGVEIGYTAAILIQEGEGLMPLRCATRSASSFASLIHASRAACKSFRNIRTTWDGLGMVNTA